MINEMFENLCRKFNDLSEILLKKEYDQLLTEIPNLGSFENYKKEQQESLNKKANKIDKSILNDNLISKEEILKDNYTINMYLLSFRVVDENMLDDEYKVKDLTYINIYEYNTIITNKLTNDYVSGIYYKQLYNQEDAQKEYDVLKKWFYDTSIEDILNDAESRINALLDEKKY